MNLLTGEYNNTIDDKGRLSFPGKLRAALNQNVLIVTKGLERCLWLFTLDEWESFQSKLLSNASMMKSESMLVIRRFIASACDVEFDKNKGNPLEEESVKKVIEKCEEKLKVMAGY